MKRKISWFVAVFMSLSLLLSTVACVEAKTTALSDEDVEVFSVPSTLKVLQDDDTSAYYANGKNLSISLAKNEYETAQLILRPKVDVGSFDLTPASLKHTQDGQAEIPVSAIEVYAQWYVELYKNSSGTNGSRRLTYYPDALIPIEQYGEYGYNSIEANNNQGITVSIKTDKATKAGTYTGIFVLTYDNMTEDIPVTVTVWDFEVPEVNHMKSAIGSPYQEELIYGQLDNTPQMYKTYIEYLLDHRICSNNIVSKQLTEEQQMEQLREYAADDRVSAYSYTQVYLSNGGVAEAERRIRLLIENSDAEHNLLKKEFIYAADEPYGKEDENSQYAKDLVDMLIRLANEYKDAGKLTQYGVTWEDIVSIEILIPYTIYGTTIDGLRTYCPSVGGCITESNRQVYATQRNNAYAGANNELAGNNYATTWWYTATGPAEPAPNQHIDNDLFSLRAIGWMTYEYKFEGYLNWSAFTYADTETLTDAIRSYGDIYYDPTDVIKATNGDGYIVYPGEKFGIEGPLPSLRMLALTDAFEDYEYLYLFNELAKQYAEKYSSPSINNLLNSLYRSVYTNVYPYNDCEAILQARALLASYIELLASDAKALVYVNEPDIKENSVTVDFYAATGTQVTVGDTVYQGTESGEGVKISVNCSLAESNYLVGTLQNGEESTALNIFLSNDIKAVTACDTAEEVAKFTPSQRYKEPRDHITLSLDDSLGEYTMKAVFGACSDPNSYESANYFPSVSISAADMFGDDKISEIDNITVRIYNPSTVNLNVYINLCSDSRIRQISEATLLSGWNTVTISNVSRTSWAYIDQLTHFSVSIDLNATEDVTLYFSDLYYTYMVR